MKAQTGYANMMKVMTEMQRIDACLDQIDENIQNSNLDQETKKDLTRWVYDFWVRVESAFEK